MSEWENKIKAYFHDPPDKALILGSRKNPKEKSKEILKRLNLSYDLPTDTADHLSSAMQRIYIPPKFWTFEIYFTKEPQKQPVFIHTLSAEILGLEKIKENIKQKPYEKVLNELEFDVAVLNKIIPSNLLKSKEWKNIFFVIWRFLPEYYPLGNIVLNKIISSYLLKNKKWKNIFFVIWRFLPEYYPLGNILPADTRTPDHSIWDQMDVTSGIYLGIKDREGLGLFSLKIPSVQEYISHSRKLSDLWASSHLFSLLIFEGLKEIIDSYGPDTIIYPQLRGNSFFDFNYILDINPALIDTNKLQSRLPIANLPNTFLCFIPLSEAEETAVNIKKRIEEKYLSISYEIRNKLKEELKVTIDEEIWKKQIKHSISIVTHSIPFFNQDEYVKNKNSLPEDLVLRQEEYLNCFSSSKMRGSYGSYYYLSFRVLGAAISQKSRLWDEWEEEPITGKKCLMCGRRNALIEKKENGKIMYWDSGKNKWISVQKTKTASFLKEKERLCAVCLTKRLYSHAYEKEFSRKKEIRPRRPAFSSVVELAAKKIIDKIRESPDEENEEIILLKEAIERDIELVYLHEWDSIEKRRITNQYNEKVKKKLEELIEKDGSPSKYYAILMMDGDRIGKTLSGETPLLLKKILHPAFRKELEEYVIEKQECKSKNSTVLEKPRMLTPSHHIAISKAMKNFSVNKVPEIVEKHEGMLIYSGGDDVLAVFPPDKVIDAAIEIQEEFKKDFYNLNHSSNNHATVIEMGMGKNATMSAGITFAHYKHPLYDALEHVRSAEKKAKNQYGRNAFCLKFIKRSGELTEAGGKWELITASDEKKSVLKELNKIVKNILEGKLSKAFIYELQETFNTLDKPEMIISILKRILNRKITKEEYKTIIPEILETLERLVTHYEKQGFSLDNVSQAIKIIFDSLRGVDE